MTTKDDVARRRTARTSLAFVIASSFLVISACDESEAPETIPPRDVDAGAASTMDSSVDASSTSPIAPDAGNGNDADAQAGEGCPRNTLCLDVRRFGETGDGLVRILWFQPYDFFLTAPADEVGFEATVGADTEQIRIPLESVRPPTDALMVCERNRSPDCENATTCPCTGATAIGVGTVVFTYNEGNANLVPLPFNTSGTTNQPDGVAPLLITYSNSSHGADDAAFISELGGLAPEGVAAGVRPNSFVRASRDTGFVQLFPTAIRLFELRICRDGEDICHLQFHFT